MASARLTAVCALAEEASIGGGERKGSAGHLGIKGDHKALLRVSLLTGEEDAAQGRGGLIFPIIESETAFCGKRALFGALVGQLVCKEQRSFEEGEGAACGIERGLAAVADGREAQGDATADTSASFVASRQEAKDHLAIRGLGSIPTVKGDHKVSAAFAGTKQRKREAVSIAGAFDLVAGMERKGEEIFEMRGARLGIAQEVFLDAVIVGER